MAEVDPKIIKKTQESLGNLFTKPPLTEKLLSRPPFRFLHDIFTAIINSSGMMKGLFTEEEMKADSVKEKEGKIKLLQKVIDFVIIALKRPIDVKPSSIVSGKECDKTNELLQCLGKAVAKKVDNTSIVKKVLSGDAKKILKSQEVNKESSKKKSKTTEENQTSNKGDKDTIKSEPPKKSADQIKTETKSEHRKKESNITKKEEPVIAEKELKIEESPKPEINVEPKKQDIKIDSEADHISKLQRPSSAKGSRHRTENEPTVNQEIELPPRDMLRPPSARPAPPKIRKSSDVVNENFGQTKVSNLIRDDDDSDSDDDYVVEEYIGGGDLENKMSVNKDGAIDENHGILVTKIMDYKKDFDNETGDGNNPRIDVERKRDRFAIEKEMEKNRLNLQNITKYIHSLSKLVDVIQEDVDNMQKENDKWKSESSDLVQKLKAENQITNKLLKPLNEKLKQQEEIRNDYEQSIGVLKTKIDENSKKISNMLVQSTLSTF